MSRNELPLILPDWPAPHQVRAVSTTRSGGTSGGAFASLNLGDHVGDNPQDVAANRAILASQLHAEPLWLTQVHGTAVIDAAQATPGSEADAAISHQPGRACSVMTADCLPVLFCDRHGSTVAAAHAGWRGLHAGILEETVKSMQVPASDILAWLGPAIGPQAFEVGEEVRTAFLSRDNQAALAFRHGKQDGKWWADLYLLARQRLAACGVSRIYGGTRCTFSEADTFFSYRRDGQTGRMASLIWLE